MSLADQCTRVYTTWAKMAHLLPLGTSATTGYPVTLCRRQPRLFASWLGTGSQAEYEKAAGLPLCARCARAVAEADRPMKLTVAAVDPADAERLGEVTDAAREANDAP